MDITIFESFHIISFIMTVSELLKSIDDTSLPGYSSKRSLFYFLSDIEWDVDEDGVQFYPTGPYVTEIVPIIRAGRKDIGLVYSPSGTSMKGMSVNDLLNKISQYGISNNAMVLLTNFETGVNTEVEKIYHNPLLGSIYCEAKK